MSGATRDDTTVRANEPARAVVWVGGEETSYLRAGCGAVMLLLMAEYDGPAALELVAMLSPAYLVIAPRVPSGCPLSTCLANVMDGLGIVSASIAAEPAFVDEARRFAEREEGRVLCVSELPR